MRQTQLHLTDDDQLVIEGIRGKGLHQSREVNRAHVLSCLDRGIHSREPLSMAPGARAKQDDEYVRKGTTNLFVAVEPKAGQRVVSATA